MEKGGKFLFPPVNRNFKIRSMPKFFGIRIVVEPPVVTEKPMKGM